MRYKLFILFLLRSFEFCAQGYDFEYIEETISDFCGQEEFGYDDLTINIISQNGAPVGYLLKEESEAIITGEKCKINDIRQINLMSKEALCNKIDFVLKGCCEQERGTFRIIPDNNFQIITQNPRVNNVVTEIELKATPGYDPLVYRWMYYDPILSQWKQFPEVFLGKSTINFTAEDLFGANYHNYIGKSIQFKIELCNGWSPSVFPYTYSFIYPSPELQDVVEVKTSCNYTKDGSFKLIVDRQLNNETLVVTLYDASNNAMVNQEVTRDLVEESNKKYSYQWQQGLDGGTTYYIKYQAKEGVVTSIPNTDPSWASLDASSPFTIPRSKALNFTIQKLNDKNCFEVNDGRIQVNAQGGETDRTFQYQYYQNGFEQSNWTNFSGTTILNNLPKATYRIQVRQVKGKTKCYAR